MSPSVTLRRLRWWDLAGAQALEREVFADEQPWSAQQWWSELAGVPKRRYYLIAGLSTGGDQVMAGYAGLALSLDTADVMTVAVRADLRGRGVGRALLDGLLDRARTGGVREVFLEVRADNAAALALYASAGFAALSRRRGYYRAGVDALTMRRREG